MRLSLVRRVVRCDDAQDPRFRAAAVGGTKVALRQTGRTARPTPVDGNNGLTIEKERAMRNRYAESIVLSGVVILGAVSAAHATPVYDAVSLNYHSPTSACDFLQPAMETGIARWRTAVAGHTVNLGPNDATIFWSEIADGDVVSGGEDDINDNLDTADLVIIGTHGGIVGSVASPTGFSLSTTTTSGNPGGDCTVQSNEMTLGDDGANFVDFYGCSVVNHELWRLTNTFETVTRLVHQVHGFNGTMTDRVGIYVDDYIDDAFDGSATWAWVDNLTDYEHWTAGGADVCAVSVVRGTSWNDALTRVNTERYDGGTNFSNVVGGVSRYAHICGCEGKDGLTGVLNCAIGQSGHTVHLK
jgi:hypothetical protein